MFIEYVKAVILVQVTRQIGKPVTETLALYFVFTCSLLPTNHQPLGPR